MSAQGKRRFPTWWQALLLLVGGFAVFFSSCAAGLSGIGSGRTPLPQSVLSLGLLLGAAMFVLGAVVMVIVIIMALVHAFTYQPALRGGGTLVAGGGTVVLTKPEAERQVLWRLRIAIGAAIFLAIGGFEPVVLLLRFRGLAAHYQLAYVSSLLLAQVPYIFALVRTARGIDRAGVAVAFASGAIDLVLRVWHVLGLPSFRGPSMRLFYFLVPGAGLAILAEVFVVAFAWQAGRMRSAEDDDSTVLLASLAAVAAYRVALHWLLPGLWRLMR